MIRAWLALALLSASWLLGLDYYQPAGPIAWIGVVAAGVALLAGVPRHLPFRRDAALAIILLVPAMAMMPWPYRVIPFLAAAGMAMILLPIPGRWQAPAGRGMVSAAVILLAQSLAVLAYAQHTARSHDLAWPMPEILGAMSWFLGIDIAVDGQTLVVHGMREIQRIPVTWELLLDPATLAFLAGGWVLLALASGAAPASGQSWPAWIRSARILTLATVLWLPVRCGLILGWLVHRVLRANPDLPLNASDFLMSPWFYLALLTIPVLLAWRLVPSTAAGPQEPDASTRELRPVRRWRYVASLLLVTAGVAIWALLVSWDPVGWRKAGRVMVVERHSTWEPSTRPYDTRSYGEPASYTYTAIYDYCSRFFDMSRLLESDHIDTRTLSRCDVLVIKTPTAPYTAEELAAILQFVGQGGGLLLIGEHTDVFKSSTYLNDIAEPLGFRFRKDLLFQIGSAYIQKYQPPAVPHPVLAHVPPMHFAVSCSVDPGMSFGRAIIQNAGLWSLPPDYSVQNYFPEALYSAEARYGSFIQLWGTRYGRGRVLAWTDSTIFSTFSAFEPGKPELMLGMLEWLNRRSLLDDPWLRLVAGAMVGLVGLAVVVGGLMLAAAERTNWLVLLSAVLLGWTLGSATTAALVRRAMPLPTPVRPMIRIALDRTVSEVPLSQGGFTRRDGQGYGLLEQWIPRQGYFPIRAAGQDALSSNALVVVCPSRSVSDEYRQALMDYVASGGRLLVLDTPDNAGTTANSLLWPFGLSMGKATVPAGTLHGKQSWPACPVETAWQIEGGEPLLWAGKVPVAARAKFGKGIVVAVGCAKLFCDANMGRHWMNQPDGPTQIHFELWYALLRNIVEDRPLEP